MTAGRRPRSVTTVTASRYVCVAAAVGLAAVWLGADVAAANPDTSGAAGSGSPAAHSKPYTDNDTAAQRHAETVAFAKRILAERPVLNGEVRLTGTSTTLVSAFDNVWIAPPWVCIGGVTIGDHISFEVTVDSHGHRWTVITPGTCCVSSVTRGTRDYLPWVDDTARFEHLVRVDSRPPS